MASNERTLEIRITLLNEEHLGSRKIEGEFNYSHGSARVRKNDRVSWWSTQGPFAVHFGAGSPFRDTLISSNPPVRNQPGDLIWKTDPLKIKGRLTGQGFHYMVAMCRKDPKDSNRDKVFIDSCPVILDEC
jgi:hypothetical protein